MGRVKVPRCDNCGAPVEFGEGVLEARCEYCGEVLIRELPPPPPVVVVAAPPPPAPRPAPRAKFPVWPFVLSGVATLVLAGASSFATFVAQLKPLPAPATDSRATLARVPEVRVERGVSVARRSEKSTSPSPPERSAPTETGTSRARRLARPTASTAPPVPTEPPPAPRFDTQAAVAGLDGAKAKAEASCKGTDGVRLFVQMGFDPDGVNRGAALSDPKLKGTPEAKCTLRIFRAVRIPAFDPATKPSGLGRAVRL